MKFRPKFFWKWSFFDQNQQPLKDVEPFERILRALFISQCSYKFLSFLDVRNASHRFRLFLRDFRLFWFFFPGSAYFSSLASPRNLPSWVKCRGKVLKRISVDQIHSGGEGNAGRRTDFEAKIERYFLESFFRERNFGRSITCLQLCSH